MPLDPKAFTSNTNSTGLDGGDGLVNLAPSDSCGVGFVASIINTPSREILELGLTSLANIQHRGATGSDGASADGAGITTSLPARLVSRWLGEIAPAAEDSAFFDKLANNLIGVGVLFLPADPNLKTAAEHMIVEQVKTLGLRTIGFREVPVNRGCVGPQALNHMPRIVQVFIDCHHNDSDQFERELFLVRRSIEITPKATGLESTYVASMSCRTISYKGMVDASRLGEFYLDLQSPEYLCSACVYHQRFSTHITPEWSLCQPYRMVAHNGEISTVRGNRNWMATRENSFQHPYWREHRGHIQRLFNFNDTDSASLDNTIELLTLSDRSLLHALAMLIPPAWKKDQRISREQKAFFEFHSCFSEPWDGPAAIAITDGKTVAACLDRNGLRPARYKITDDDILLVGSEAGADRIDDSRVVAKGRLAPGEMLAVDLLEKRLLKNDEIKDKLAGLAPYQDWLDECSFEFHPRRHVETDEFENVETPEFEQLRIAAGLDSKTIASISSMAVHGKESHSADTSKPPSAAMDPCPQPLSDYFNQRVAQVMHPAIDSIHERQGMSLSTGLGPERNILSESANHCRVLNLDNPILLPDDLGQLEIQSPFIVHKIDCTWHRDAGPDGLKAAIRSVVQSAQLAIEQDATILVLSDRAVSDERIAIPMLLAIGAVHHGLCQTSHRMMCSIVIETSQVWDSHQLSLMFGYGATSVYPYLAYGTIARLHFEEAISGPTNDSFRRYRSALTRGLLKVLSETGVSLLNSFQGAQIFDVIGLDDEVISTCFLHSHANLRGTGFTDLASDCIARHDAAFSPTNSQTEFSDNGDSSDGSISGKLFEIVSKSGQTIELENVETSEQILRRLTTKTILKSATNLKRGGTGARLDGFISRHRQFHATPEPKPDDADTYISVCPRTRNDTNSIEDLAQLIHEVNMVEPGSEVCVRLVAQTGVGGIAVGLAKADTDSILINGSTSDQHKPRVGLPWVVGVAEAHQTLVASSLRNRVVLKTAGDIRNAHDIICGAILGAEEFVLSLDGEPARQREKLVAIAGECREILARIGIGSIDEIVGQTEFLAAVDSKAETNDARSATPDITNLLHRPSIPFDHRPTAQKRNDFASHSPSFDDRLVTDYSENGTTEFEFDICNIDRTIGTKLAGVVSPPGQRQSNTESPTVKLKLRGSAGQSLGAYLSHGVQIDLTGEANDFVGKRMGGGEIVIRSTLTESSLNENLVVGNASLYGATGGRLFAAGEVAERFAVRNSGATAVVEGCGDHGCELMTAGTVVILGSVGINFATGMTGGKIFLWDPDQKIDQFINRKTATTSVLTVDEANEVQQLVTDFQNRTGSTLAERLLANWQHTLLSFRKVCAKQATQAANSGPNFNRRRTDSTVLSS